MEILDSNISTNRLTPLIGEPIKSGIKGSTVYFIKEFKPINNEFLNYFDNHKGIFERYTNGLLFRTFKSNKSITLPISKDNIKRLTLIKGDEEVNPIPLFPVWILLQLGISIEIARYFRVRFYEYQIDETVLTILTDDFEMKLITNGYTFNSQQYFFEQLGLNSRLEIKKARA